jgi:phage gpG-like protein
MSFAEHRKIIEDMKRFQNEIGYAVDRMGTLAVNHFKASFRDGGFTDKTPADNRWPSRKNIDKKRPYRATLVDSGDLRRLIVFERKGKYTALISSAMPYAVIHNEGGEGKAWGKHRFRMPKRQFVGYSRRLAEKIEHMIYRQIDKLKR